MQSATASRLLWFYLRSKSSETRRCKAAVQTQPGNDRYVGLQSENSSNNRRSQFRPRPSGKAGATSYQLRQYAEATLGGGSLRKIVKLPEGEDENEWFAVNSTPAPRMGNARRNTHSF